MSFKKKLRKLRKNPKLFFQDSYPFKKWGISKLEQKIDINTKLSSEQDEGNISTAIVSTENINIIGENALLPRCSYDFSELASQIYNAVRCFTIIDEYECTRPIICILKENLPDFYCKLAELSFLDNLLIQYMIKGKLTTPRTYAELIKHLFHRKVVDLQVVDQRSGCHIYFSIEVWENVDGVLIAPRSNYYTRKIYLEERYFDTKSVPDIKDFFEAPHEDSVLFDVDIVFTWVNSEDLHWQEIYRKFKPDSSGDSNSLSRFKNREELKYALRSIDCNASWVRKIFIVSNCNPPEWLDLSSDKIEWIYHENIIENNQLPTFNSHAIETSLHKISGLSKYFIYSNDDCFLAGPTKKDDFFFSNGVAKLRFEPYGIVHGERNVEDPDYLNAARNGQRLLLEHFNKVTTQLHTHTLQGLNKDVLYELESLFYSEFESTRSNRFRHINDISVTSYLYQHYCYLSGYGVKDYTPTSFIKHTDDFSKKFNSLLKEQSNIKKGRTGVLPLSICINDGADSFLNNSWDVGVLSFLKNYFPKKSAFEK